MFFGQFLMLADMEQWHTLALHLGELGDRCHEFTYQIVQIVQGTGSVSGRHGDKKTLEASSVEGLF